VTSPADDSPLPCAPAAERNKEPILEVLERILPRSGTVLEIASGTGQHAAHFAAALPGVAFQPSDADPLMVDAARRRRAAAGLPNLEPPVVLDALADPWPVTGADAMIAINLLHISPWAVTSGLLRGAAAVLGSGGRLAIYGPFFRDGVPTAPSNLAFDASLRARNPAWGVRRLEDVAEVAARHGFDLEEAVEMPANNIIAVFRRRAGSPHVSRARASAE
jgi:SAM-dependent methyltransferase